MYPLQVAESSDMDIREIFARNLRSARRARGFSQEELAHRADLDRTYISSLERNVYSATIDVVDRLAFALSVEPGALLDRSFPDFKKMPPAKSAPTD